MKGKVRHIEGRKRIWNYPREVRTSRPALYRGYLSLLFSNDKYSTLKDKYIQSDFNHKLSSMGLKRKVKNRDSNPGGVRTLLSQLEGLCLIFRDVQTGLLWPTLAGEELMNGDALKVMRLMVLKYQYPNSGTEKIKIKMNPLIKIKPNLFILKLLKDNEVKTLTVEELFVPILYGHNENCYDLCKTKILEIRSGKEWFEIVDSFQEDLYTTNKKFKINKEKIKTNSLEIRSWYNYLKDIATTIIPLLKDVQLVNSGKNSRGDRYILLPDEIGADVEEALEKSSNIIKFQSDFYESFQRKVGVVDKKDTRELTKDSVYNKELVYKIQIKNHFLIRHANNKIYDTLPARLVQKYCDEFSIDTNSVKNILEPFLETAYSEFEQNLIMASQSGTEQSRTFEKLLAELFRKKFGFHVEETGDKKRKVKGHNFADLYIVDKKKENVIIGDAKAIKNYSLILQDEHKMKSYIDSVAELNEEYYPGKKMKLILGIFIANSLSKNFNNNSISLHKQVKPVHISGIAISELLALSKTKKIVERQKELVNALSKSGTVNMYVLN